MAITPKLLKIDGTTPDTARFEYRNGSFPNASLFLILRAKTITTGLAALTVEVAPAVLSSLPAEEIGVPPNPKEWFDETDQLLQFPGTYDLAGATNQILSLSVDQLYANSGTVYKHKGFDGLWVRVTGVALDDGEVYLDIRGA